MGETRLKKSGKKQPTPGMKADKASSNPPFSTSTATLNVASEAVVETKASVLESLHVGSESRFTETSKKLRTGSVITSMDPSGRMTNPISVTVGRTKNLTSENLVAEENSKSTDPSGSSLIELKHTPGKGYALFSTEKIPAGTLVLAENPCIRLTRAEEQEDNNNNEHPRVEGSSTAGVDDGEKPDSNLNRHFKNLPKGTQKLYLKLHDSKKAGFDQVASIYYSNCYNLASRSEQGGSCIGLLAARINHSCVPNVQFSFVERSDDGRDKASSDNSNGDGSRAERPNSTEQRSRERDLANRHRRRAERGPGTIQFRAIKPIPRGREICANYSTVFATRAQRQSEQMLHYGFRCDCEACTTETDGFWAGSDARRREMIRLRKDVKNNERLWNTTGHTATDDVKQNPDTQAAPDVSSNASKTVSLPRNPQSLVDGPVRTLPNTSRQSVTFPADSPTALLLEGADASEPSSTTAENRDDRSRNGNPQAKSQHQTQQERVHVARLIVDDLELVEGLMLKEGLLGNPLVNVYGSLVKWAARAGDDRAVEKWKTKESDVRATIYGEPHPRGRKQ